MKRRTLLAASVAALGLASAGAAFAADKTKVGFVFVGPIGDGGWTYEHNEGRLAVEEHFGDAVETIYQESVPEGADAERVLTQMALSGADLIFTTSFGYMDPTLNVAAKFPDVKFEHATGYKRADNVSTYSARFYEGRAVQGTIAGHMTKSNVVGYIASFPIPEVIRGINSAYIHAKKVNPDVEFKVIWAYTWFDPAKEADAANALIEQGADVILQHTDSTAPQAAAEKAGNVITFGQASDMGEYAPMPRVSSIIDNWAPYYIARTQAVIDGSWTSVDTWDGIGAGMVGIGEISSAVPEDVKAEALALKDAIANGSYHPFTGPLKKQDGSDWLAEGETADDGTLAGMNFYVEGITGDIPQ
ncbi:BMP family ABC transporter substrate-binding protein [Actibacterium sp. XHP0104]|uniref:BMP family ABC transporter substrate-binding protein n=1 Tax=Actibacterium sp. XHP0104 TaxID=2984335 RepID=UPI0021E8D36E|nr:BMP family ABC transporter substrate-binding protein [Actibacterium sp. XHP0104]MCV2882239.1 BMP family ABC transporter substrate-binding protein [Actibacterium sp. XHP0104]